MWTLLAAVLGVATVILPVQAQAQDGPVASAVLYPPPGWCDIKYTQEPYGDPDLPNAYTRHYFFRACVQPERLLLYYTQSGVIDTCLGRGGAYLGPQWSVGAPPYYTNDMFIGATHLGHCDTVDPDPPLPPYNRPPDAPRPVVTVNGSVATANAALPVEPSRPFSNARAEVWYFGKAGNGATLDAWHPVLTDDDEPVPVELYLNEQGEFRADFVYPQSVQWQSIEWRGCQEDEYPVPFLEGNACAHEALELRIFAEDRDVSVAVWTDDMSGVHQIGAVPIGHFFEEPDEDVHGTIDSPAGHMYRASIDVQEAVPANAVPPILTTLLAPSVTVPGYHPGSNTVVMPPAAAAGSAPEHELGHAVAHQLYGNAFDTMFGHCSEVHHWVAPHPDGPTCAFSEGLADFIGTYSETRIGLPPVSWDQTSNSQAMVESCGLRDSKGAFTQCATGPGVESRVAGALYDLADPGPETIDGVTETAHNAMADLLAVIAQEKPNDITAFWTAWRSAHGGSDRMAMYLNTVLGHVADDRDATAARGTWTEALCLSCRGATYRYSEPDAGPAELDWRLGKYVQNLGQYDIWVRLPAGSASNDPGARYRISTTNGWREVLVDQSAAVDGWVNLFPGGITLDPMGMNRLLLSRTTPSRTVMADAVIIAPHES